MQPRTSTPAAAAHSASIINTSLDTAVQHVARDGIEAITVPSADHKKLAEASNGAARERREELT